MNGLIVGECDKTLFIREPYLTNNFGGLFLQDN